jgi:hypothetical protein
MASLADQVAALTTQVAALLVKVGELEKHLIDLVCVPEELRVTGWFGDERLGVPSLGSRTLPVPEELPPINELPGLPPGLPGTQNSAFPHR